MEATKEQKIKVLRATAYAQAIEDGEDIDEIIERAESNGELTEGYYLGNGNVVLWFVNLADTDDEVAYDCARDEFIDKAIIDLMPDDRDYGIKDLAKAFGISEKRVYQIAKEVGHLPTVAELYDRRKSVGRPKKYTK